MGLAMIIVGSPSDSGAATPTVGPNPRGSGHLPDGLLPVAPKQPARSSVSSG